MKLPVFFVFCFLWPSWLLAQQRPQYSQYVINNYLINPAISGIEDYADIKLGFRNQWTGMKGAPATLYLTGHTKFGGSTATNALNAPANKPSSFGTEKADFGRYRRLKAHHGLGGIILHDKIGPFARTEISASYAYHIPLTANMQLAGGLAAGVISQALRPDYLDFADAGDVMDTGWSKFSPTFSGGVWLYSANFYAGASAVQLFTKGNAPATENTSQGRFTNHYFLTAAYKVQPLPSIAIIPSVLVKYMQPLPVSLDYNLRVMYADRLWGGLAFRQHDSFAFLGGLTINHYLDISYAYDLGVSELGNQTGGSHEVVLGVRLNNRNKIICPQNLW